MLNFSKRINRNIGSIGGYADIRVCTLGTQIHHIYGSRFAESDVAIDSKQENKKRNSREDLPVQNAGQWRQRKQGQTSSFKPRH